MAFDNKKPKNAFSPQAIARKKQEKLLREEEKKKKRALVLKKPLKG